MFRLFITLFFTSLFLCSYSHDQSNIYQFIENKGQWASNIKYRTELGGGRLYLENDGFTYHLYDLSEVNRYHGNKYEIPDKIPHINQHAFKVNFINSSENIEFKQSGESSNYYNFFKGKDESKWKSNVHSYSDITYNDIYSGIDLKIYNQNYDLKYDLIIAPNADPSKIKFEYDGIDKIFLEDGKLRVETSLGMLTEEKPWAYQKVNGKFVTVACNYILNGNVLSYEFPNGYNKSIELVIDPTLIFSSYSGSYSDNFGMTATYDESGHLYSGGMAYDIGFPTTLGAYDTTSNVFDNLYGITDVVITKYDPTGTSLIYSTYFGGGNDTLGTETVHSLIVDSQDNLCLFGITSSTDFPTSAGAYDNTFNGGLNFTFQNNGTRFDGGSDFYISKFSSDGSTLLASTIIGGSENDGANYNVNVAQYDSLQFNYGDQFRGEIMVDGNDNIYVASCTKSPDFPIVNGFGTNLQGTQAGIVMKFDSNLQNLLWSTFLNGNKKDACYSIKVDENEICYVTGGTYSTTFPIVGSTYQTSYQGGAADGFIAKIAADGTSLLASTYLGTSEYDQSFFLELDRNGEVHVFGQTEGMASFPVTPGVYSNPNSGQFITSLNKDLDAINYSTLFGNSRGRINISPAAFLVDYCGNIYISGWGEDLLQNSFALDSMPITSDAFQSTSTGYDFYLMVLEADAQGLIFGTYYGGATSREHVDGGTSRFNKDGVVYQSVCAGCGGNSDFPTSPFTVWSDTNLSSNCNNGVFKFDFGFKPVSTFSTDTIVGCDSLLVTFSNNSVNYDNFFWDLGNGDTTSTILNPSATYYLGTYEAILTSTNEHCDIGDTTKQVIIVYDNVQANFAVSDTGCLPQTVNFTNLSEDYIDLSWDFGIGTDTIENPIVVYNTPGTYNIQLIASNNVCQQFDTTNISITVDPIPVLTAMSDTILCESQQIDLSATSQFTDGTYTWSTFPDFSDTLNINDSIISVTPLIPTMYYVMVNNQHCSNIDSIYIDFLSNSIIISPDTGICIGDDIVLSIIQTSNIDSLTSIDWSPDSLLSIDGETSTTVSPNGSQYFSVSGTSYYGCDFNDSVYVSVDYLPNTINAWVEEDSMYIGSSTIAHAEPAGFNYNWTPITQFNSPNNSVSVVSPGALGPNIYSVDVTNGYCLRSDTIIIYAFEFECGPPNIFLPNAFTPNGDGNNDILKVRGGNLETLYFTVYDRWGEMMFETDDINIGWDGNFKGKGCDPAVYVYYLKGECIDGQEYLIKGNVTLIR